MVYSPETEAHRWDTGSPLSVSCKRCISSSFCLVMRCRSFGRRPTCSHISAVAISIFNPKPVPIQLPVSPSEPLHPTLSSPASNSSLSRSLVRPKGPKCSPSFDLALARISLGIELVCYIGMTLAMSSWSWTAATLFGAFGGGVSPAMQSVALALYERGPNRGIETGRLFGGLSVVQALRRVVISSYVP